MRHGAAQGGRPPRPKSESFDWDALIAYVAANTGWTFDQVLDTMNDDRFRALQAEWTRHPPAHWLIAHYLGYQEPEEVQHMTREAAQAFMAATGGRVEGVKKLGEP